MFSRSGHNNFLFKKMVKRLKDKLKKDGRTLRWFHLNYFKKRRSTLTYNAVALQLNGYVQINDRVKKAINKYLSVK